MDLWGSEAEIGDEVYHIKFGKVRIDGICATDRDGLIFRLLLSNGLLHWEGPESLSWKPFTEFDRGKKKKIKKWKWAIPSLVKGSEITSGFYTEKEALDIFHTYGVKLPWTEVEE